MSNDPYAAPSADLDTSSSSAAIKTSAWTAKGRLSVLSYWGQSALLFLFTILGFMALVFAARSTGISMDGMSSGDPEQLAAMLTSGAGGVVALIGIVLYLLLLYFTVCLLIKRLHDRNHTGWWSILIFIPIIGLIPLLYAGTVPGKKEGNRFGGRRETRGWEKVLGALSLLLTIVALGIVAFAYLNGIL